MIPGSQDRVTAGCPPDCVQLHFAKALTVMKEFKILWVLGRQDQPMARGNMDT